MAIGIKILHLAIVCPLVRNVECCLDGTPIGIISVLEQSIKELLIETIDGIVKGQENKLGDVFGFVPPGDGGSATITIG